MTRAIVIGIGLFLIFVTMLGLYAPHTEIESIMNLSQNSVIMRLSASAMLLFYGIFQSFRLPAMKALFKVLGLSAICGGTIGIFVFYLLPIDIFNLLVVGIFALLASIELPETASPTLPLKWLMAPRIAFPAINKSIRNFVSEHKQRPVAQA